ncbi:unnamed protein product [Effrenium voratum]|nr:unnamed protein product [Effrenium voratum]
MDTSFKPQDPVPGWDGNARGWRRYSREVAWYVLGTKKNQRAFLAPRLISKLSGPARLLAMSWNQRDFKGNQGVQVLLQRLAASPLVRKNLPNTSAIMNQYFTYKRFQQESIANYLVRESLYYEEFVESLMALKDEQIMVKKKEKNLKIDLVLINVFLAEIQIPLQHHLLRELEDDWSWDNGSWGADWDYWAATAYPAWPEEDFEWPPDDSPPGEDGKGRLNHLGYYDEEYLHALGKGKGKFKSKKSGKSAHYMEDLYYAKGKGYGFPSDKGKSKSKGKGMVNAYTMDYFSDGLGFNVLDFQHNPTMDLQSSTKALGTPVQKNQPASRAAASHGMLDSGATCSAGPETSIQNLVISVISYQP